MTSLRDAWSRGAGAYKQTEDVIFPVSQEITRILEQTYSTADSIRILDIACGTGQPCVLLAQTFPKSEISATDFAPGMVEQAKAVATSAGIKNIKFAVADAQDLSQFDNSSFDVISCVAALFLVPDPNKALKEFKRVLKPGGKLIATNWGAPEDTNFATSVIRARTEVLTKHGIEPPQQPKSPLELWKPEECKKAVQSADFHHIIMSEFNVPMEFSGKALEDFGGHPMMLMLKPALAKMRNVSEGEAYAELCTQIQQIATDKGWMNADLMTFPRNLAHIILAEA